MNEELELKDIPNFNGYKASRCGDIYSFKHKKVKKLSRVKNCRSGYIYVNMRNNEGKRCHVSLHRCVAKTWVDNPNNLKEVNHIDHDKENAKAENLEWVSGEQNKQKYRRFQGKKRGVQYSPNKNKTNPFVVKFKTAGLPTLNLGSYKQKETAYNVYFETYKEWFGIAPW